MSVEIEIRGEEGVRARLLSLIKRIIVVEEAIEGLPEEMMQYMVNDAKTNCPVKTGRLRDSIHSEGSFPFYHLIADATDTKGVPYGPFVEYGTSRQQAQPFLWPAVYTAIGVYGPQIKGKVLAFIAS